MRVTVKEVTKWMKTLEENRYRKIVGADARRVAWLINNSMSEDYDTMPKTLRKRWEHAKYGKERYVANKYLQQHIQNEAVTKNTIRKMIKEVICEEINLLREEKIKRSKSVV